MAKASGTEWFGDREVPCFETTPGETVDAAAKKLGFRVLGRREAGEVVAVIADGGLHFRCVAVQS